MANNGDYESILKEKESMVEHDLGACIPLIVISCKDGIVFGTKSFLLLNKIAEVYDRICFGAIGKNTKWGALRETVIKQAIVIGSNYAREDVRVENLAKVLGKILDDVYTTPKALPWSVEIILAEVNEKPEADKLLIVNYKGMVKSYSGPYVIIGRNTDNLKAKIQELTREKKFSEMGFNQVIKLVRDALATLEPDENEAELKVEIATLSRKKSGRKFERVKN